MASAGAASVCIVVAVGLVSPGMDGINDISSSCMVSCIVVVPLAAMVIVPSVSAVATRLMRSARTFNTPLY
jgi:hypothetical protein